MLQVTQLAPTQRVRCPLRYGLAAWGWRRGLTTSRLASTGGDSEAPVAASRRKRERVRSDSDLHAYNNSPECSEE